MWFKNLLIYRFTKDIDLSPEYLETSLQEKAFKPCESMDFSRYGWLSPLGKNGKMLSHYCANHIMLCARKQEKILPPTAINEIVEDKINDLEQAQARNIYRKEKHRIKDDVIHSLLPRALTRSSLIYAYIDQKQKLLIINAASSNKAEEFMDLLRSSLGGLPIKPIKTSKNVSGIMTNWLNSKLPKGFELGTECELQNPNDSKNIAQLKNQELENIEITTHLKSGKQASKLELIWKDSIRFVLDGNFTIKKIRFEEIIQDQAKTDDNDFATQFDLDFSIMSVQINQLIKDLLNEFGDSENKEESM